MLRITSMTLSLLAAIAVYTASNIVPFNGKTTTEIMNRLPVLFTPANYVFVIWVLIYLLLVGWLYHFLRTQHQHSRSILNTRAFLFNLSNILTILWILLWHYEYFNWTIIAMVALLVTLATLYFTYPKAENQLFGRVPISIYFGWVIISFMELTFYMLTLHEWSGWGISSALWTVIFLTVATLIALHFMYHHRDLALNLVLMWVFLGIAAKNGFDTLFVTSASLFLTAVIGASFFFIKKP